jgi:hypothetical protein
VNATASAADLPKFRRKEITRTAGSSAARRLRIRGVSSVEPSSMNRYSALRPAAPAAARMRLYSSGRLCASS